MGTANALREGGRRAGICDRMVMDGRIIVRFSESAMMPIIHVVVVVFMFFLVGCCVF
jgi:hypothetical protein